MFTKRTKAEIENEEVKASVIQSLSKVQKLEKYVSEVKNAIDEGVAIKVEASKWYCNNGIPKKEEGEIGDLYIDIDTNDYYQKNKRDWKLVANIKGEQGESGVNGLDGTDGYDGIDGTNGADGIEGKNGLDGRDGRDGKDGKDGENAEQIELRKTNTHIQWRRGTGKWINLVALSELKGKDGHTIFGGGGGGSFSGSGITEIIAGTNITIDNTNPSKPIISATGGGGAVDSVNGQIGVVVLDTDDIADTAINRYTNDTDITRLANTSGTNTGDQDLSPYFNKSIDDTDDIVDTATNRFTSDTDITRLANTSGTNTGDQDLSGLQPLVPLADPNFVWHGDKTFSNVVEADILLSDNTINNVNTNRHGFMSKLPGGTTVFYRGDGTFATPADVTIPNAYIIVSFTGTTYNLIHNFGSYPVVQILDSTGAVVGPLSIVNNTVNDLTVTFTSSGTYTIIATLGSPQLQNYTATSVNYLALVTDKIIEVTASNVVITLPTANVTNTGFEYKIDNSSNGDIEVIGQGGETIQGLSEQIIPSNSSMNIYANGVAWRIT